MAGPARSLKEASMLRSTPDSGCGGCNETEETIASIGWSQR